MKKLELKVCGRAINIKSYTYNVFNDDIRDYDVYVDYLNNNLNNLDFTKIDKFVDYIYEVIDNMDYVFIEGIEDGELNFYKNNFKYIYYDKIHIDKLEANEVYANYLFDIRDKLDKRILKDNIRFNLCNEYQDIIIIDTDRKYILNDNSRGPIIEFRNNDLVYNNLKPYYYNRYCFVKDGCLQLILNQEDGYITDYRDIDELSFLKRKDLKVENKNYDTYDYTKFSNDINDNKYIDYIYNIVDNADYIFINHLSYKQECKYKDKLDYIYYDKILFEDKSRDFETNYVFDIKDSKSKQFIKDDIKFNLSDKDRNPILVDNNKKYIFNEIEKEEYEYMDYCFIKDDYLLVVLHQRDGYIADYR